MSLADLYKEVGKTKQCPWPKVLLVRATTSKSLFCEYHNGFEHQTEDCHDLQDTVKQLIREGRMARYIALQRSPKKRKASSIRDEE